ncbi:hypothetical protein L1887_50284 [Cichorium endivia]|nr:hypothetical protein L1887_50284 [Cichorium endivia]
MLIALSAFALCQPVDSTDPVDSSSRKRKVRRLLEESVKMRNSALLGSHPSLEAIMCSFFIFGTLFGLGEENAAWFRLREAVTLGYLLRIHETSSYENLDKDEQERRLRAYLLLAITERAYAIQSGSSITFRGNPRKATDSIRRKFDVAQLQDFPNLQSRLFDVVDEKFVDCWNRKCPGPGCDYLDAQRAVQLHRAIKESDEDEQKEKESFHRDRANTGPMRRDTTHGERRHHPYASHMASGAKAEDAPGRWRWRCLALQVGLGQEQGAEGGCGSDAPVAAEPVVDDVSLARSADGGCGGGAAAHRLCHRHCARDAARVQLALAAVHGGARHRPHAQAQRHCTDARDRVSRLSRHCHVGAIRGRSDQDGPYALWTVFRPFATRRQQCRTVPEPCVQLGHGRGDRSSVDVFDCTNPRRCTARQGLFAQLRHRGHPAQVPRHL